MQQPTYSVGLCSADQAQLRYAARAAFFEVCAEHASQKKDDVHPGSLVELQNAVVNAEVFVDSIVVRTYKRGLNCTFTVCSWGGNDAEWTEAGHVTFDTIEAREEVVVRLQPELALLKDGGARCFHIFTSASGEVGWAEMRLRKDRVVQTATRLFRIWPHPFLLLHRACTPQLVGSGHGRPRGPHDHGWTRGDFKRYTGYDNGT